MPWLCWETHTKTAGSPRFVLESGFEYRWQRQLIVTFLENGIKRLFLRMTT